MPDVSVNLRGVRHLPAIDGLRAIAVLAVVAYHAGLIPSGFVGVDVFFAISGYLITRLLADELRDTGRIDFVHFYARRAKRILPAALLVVAVVLAVSATILPSGGAEVAESATAAGLFGANFYFQAATGGYWAAPSQSMPLLHLWSLSVEEQFYLVWPLLLILVRRRPVAWLVGVASLSFVLAEALLLDNPNAAFYQMPARAWELAVGGLVAFAPTTARSYPEMAWLALCCVLASCVFPIGHFPGYGALPAVAGASALLYAIHRGGDLGLAGRVLCNRVLVYVGLISYSLYLWHWPLLAIDRALRVGDAPILSRLVLCAAAFVLAAMSYRYIETPFRRSRASPRRAVASAAACIAALSCSAFALASAAPHRALTVPTAASLQCHPWGAGVKAQMQPGRCVPAAPKIVLWGDSFAGPWEPYVLSLADRQGFAAVSMVEPGCPAVIGVAVPRTTPRASQFCQDRAAQALRYLQANGADTLIVASHWARLLHERPDAGPGVLAWAKALPKVRRIIVVGATPEMRDAVEHCIDLGEPCDITRAEFDRSSAPTRRVMDELAVLPNVEVLPLGDWLCDARICPGVRDGRPLYFKDNHHVAAWAVAAFVKERVR